jgi:hypothetical protein
MLESELAIIGSAGEFGSFRAAPPTFRDVRFHLKRKRGAQSANVATPSCRVPVTKKISC